MLRLGQWGFGHTEDNGHPNETLPAGLFDVDAANP